MPGRRPTRRSATVRQGRGHPATHAEGVNLGVLRDALDAAVPLHGQLVCINGKQVARADPDDPSTVIRREAQLLVHYRDSPLVGDGGGCLKAPLPGERAPDCRGLRRAAVSHPLRLFELLAHPHNTLLLYADDSTQLPAVTELAQLAGALAGGRIKTYLIGAATSTRLDGHSIPLIIDEAGEFQSIYGATGGTGYLARPDGYVGFPRSTPDLRRFAQTSKACSPHSPGQVGS